MTTIRKAIEIHLAGLKAGMTATAIIVSDKFARKAALSFQHLQSICNRRP